MTKKPSLARAVIFIKTHWQQNKSLKEIASEFGIDAGNLERAFSKQEGITVKQFADHKRKEYVLTRLKKSFVLGFEIGDELGFKNDLAFYRWAKRAFGVSFAELRKSVKE